jgi:hypothetical protein
MDDSRRSIWYWFAFLGAALPLLYLALLGPVCWLYAHDCISQESLWLVFRPFARSFAYIPRPARNPFARYLNFWGMSDLELLFLLSPQQVPPQQRT